MSKYTPGKFLASDNISEIGFRLNWSAVTLSSGEAIPSKILYCLCTGTSLAEVQTKEYCSRQANQVGVCVENASSFTAVSKQSGTKYFYNVVATDQKKSLIAVYSGVEVATLGTPAVESNALASFAITSPLGPVKTTSPQVTWQSAGKNATYDVTVSSDATCSATIKSLKKISTLSYDVVPGLADGTYYLCVTAYDASGTAKAATNSQASFTVDSIAPGTFAITGPVTQTNSATPTVTWGAASGATKYTVHLDTNSDCVEPFAASLSGVTGASGTIPSVSDSNYRACVFASDDAGNTVPSSNSGTFAFRVDATAPAISVTSLPTSVKPGSRTVAWTMSEILTTAGQTFTVEISSDGTTWSSLATPTVGGVGPYTNGSFSTSVTIPATETTSARIRVSFTDLAGNVGSGTSALFAVDNTAPIVTAININSGAGTTSSNYVSMDLTATDAGPGGGTTVKEFCFKYNTTVAPLTTDSCWVAVSAPSPGITASNAISFTNFSYTIGFTSATYTVYGWAKDGAENISALSSAGAGTNSVDRKAIVFTQPLPPVVSKVFATSTVTPANPPSNANKTATSGSAIHIKWRATDTVGFGATPITLSYTTDSVNFTQIITNLNNGSNSGCTVNEGGTTLDDQATGCYQWTSPTSGFIAIRVSALNSSGYSGFAQSNEVNTGNFNVIAGNMETGLGGAAKSAVYFPWGGVQTPQILAVDNIGRIYLLDPRGLTVVDPADGMLKTMIPTTGSFTGDGGPVTSATLGAPSRIALDYQNNLLIADWGRILKVVTSTNPMTISTLIGGGGQTADGVAATSLYIDSSYQYMSDLIPAPNGDIYFKSNYFNNKPADGANYRRYNAATGTVSTIPISGNTTVLGVSNVPLDQCNMSNFGVEFNLATSQLNAFIARFKAATFGGVCSGPFGNYTEYVDSIRLHPTSFAPLGINAPLLFNGTGYREETYPPYSGLDGKIYAISTDRANSSYINRYNSSTNTWTIVAGTSLRGQCTDGTAALSCHLKSDSMFVNPQGKIYIFEGHTVRTIQDNGTMLTLAGQRKSYGDAGLATDARFNDISSLKYWFDGSQGRVVIADRAENRIREVTIGANATTLAGTGVAQNPTINATAASSQSFNFEGDNPGVTVAVNSSNGDVYGRFSNFPIKLNRASGLWEQPFSGSLIGYGPHILGISGTHLLSADHGWSVALGSSDSKIYTYHLSTFVRTTLLETITPASNANDFCSDGTVLTNCNSPLTFYTNTSQAHWDSHSGGWIIKSINSANDRIVRLIPGGNMQTVVTLPRAAWNFGYNRDAGLTVHNAYYCGSDLKMYKYNILTSTETQLSFPAGVNYSCKGYVDVQYVSTRNSVIFGITNPFGLQGVAEIVNP